MFTLPLSLAASGAFIDIGLLLLTIRIHFILVLHEWLCVKASARLHEHFVMEALHNTLLRRWPWRSHDLVLTSCLPRMLSTARSIRATAPATPPTHSTDKRWKKWLRPGQRPDVRLKPERRTVRARKSRVFAKDDQKFESMGVSQPLVAALHKLQFSRPTVVQYRAVPKLLRGRDAIVAAETGTGKTLTFLLPAFERCLRSGLSSAGTVASRQPKESKSNCSGRSSNAPTAVIVAPTRELCAQIGEHAKRLGSLLRIPVAVVDNNNTTYSNSGAGHVNAGVIVGVPGQLSKLLASRQLSMRECQMLVLDEADMLLDDFDNEILPLLKACKPSFRMINDLTDIGTVLEPIQADEARRSRSTTSNTAVAKDRTQLVATAASMTQASFSLLQHQLPKLQIIASQNLHVAPANIEHVFLKLRGPNAKPDELLAMAQDGAWHRAMVFFNSSRTLAWASHFMVENGIDCIALTGDMSKSQRNEQIIAFKQQKSPMLLCTDIAARGLDFPQIDLVVNFDFPRASRDYLHRVGRTGRLGRRGKVVSFVSKAERHAAHLIEGATVKQRHLGNLYNFGQVANANHRVL